MNTAFDMLGVVSPGRESWRFKVRVLRLWTTSSFLQPEVVNTLEMVLIDEKGVKIHASVRRQLLYLFQSKISEGNVYKMSYFTVSPASGFYRTTPHPYKLVFQLKTKVQVSESNKIDLYGLSLTKISDIHSEVAAPEFLVDVIGVITGMSADREYIRDGKVVKMIVFELTDQSGKCECALFGDYVHSLQSMLGKAHNGLPVVVVQFAKIKTFRGSISIQNIINATRLFVNPAIEEADALKNGIAANGIETPSTIPLLGARAKPSYEEDFLLNYPKITIAELVEKAEDGVYVVCAVVDGLVEGEDWWYPACNCHRSVVADSGAYYCKVCVKHVYQMFPRYKVKFRVADSTGNAVFVVFDSDMRLLIHKDCSDVVAAFKPESSIEYPTDFKLLKGMRLLFKVEKVTNAFEQFDVSYKVKRVCNELSTIEAFGVPEVTNSPTRVLSSGFSESEDESDMEHEFVEDSLNRDIVVQGDGDAGCAGSLEAVHVKDSVVDSAGEVISLDDDSDAGITEFVSAASKLAKDAKLFAVKRNLSSAFAECNDIGESSNPSKCLKTKEE
ncbi:replication protein A 70 kDa DNA-binding subunit B-like isoform X2 [Trifolium pratense]|uniref:replication protein A 70 kDa DNA-binding subunit B-like isoform X2 n=1 Tax=Trifolium pratense TaxID=57577 RepID=UPI001E696BF1|nr:replication protein A 70 kDa DNA-binding subunit B-like isoform X2 [Trifolium pratense]